MNSPILDALCLAHHSRWIEISDAKGWVRLVCSNCGEPKTCRKKNIPKVCPGCKEKWRASDESEMLHNMRLC